MRDIDIFLRAFLTGMVIEALWEMGELVRNLGRRSRIITGVSDGVFCLLTTGILAHMLYSSQVQSIRGYIVAALLAGLLWKKELKILFKKATIKLKDHRGFKEGQ